ncbi:Uncharacterised protein [Collinsella intestinalis]|nr:Uncharacterised protein [Collinsella intestinalis]
MLERAAIVHKGVHVVDHSIDLLVEQGVRRQSRGLDLRVGQKLELVARIAVDHGNLDRPRLLARLIHRELTRELRETVAPLHTGVHRVRHRLGVRAVGQVGGVEAATHTVDDLHAENEHEHAHDHQHGRARDGLAHLRARGVIIGKRVDRGALCLFLRRPLLRPSAAKDAARELFAPGGIVGVKHARCVELGEQVARLFRCHFVLFAHRLPHVTRSRALELHSIVPSIRAATSEKLFMGAALHNATTLHRRDLVGVFDG